MALQRMTLYLMSSVLWQYPAGVGGEQRHMKMGQAGRSGVETRRGGNRCGGSEAISEGRRVQDCRAFRKSSSREGFIIQKRRPFSKARLQHSQTVIQPCKWFMEEPSQFSIGETAQSHTCSITEKPHTWLDECLRMLQACFRKRMSD